MLQASKKNVLTLKHFVFQAELIHAYRSAVRSTRPLPDSHSRRETLDWLRVDLERLRFITDLDMLRSQLSAFQRSVKIFAPQLGLTGVSEKAGSRLIGRRRSNSP